jgi:beta-xylosidase
VELASGESWFVHFQDKGAYGRIVHLEPLVWKEGWPVIGSDPDGDGRGEPVVRYKKPAVTMPDSIGAPQTSDEFETGLPGLQWQWPANPSHDWIQPAGAGVMRMAAVPLPSGSHNLHSAANLLLQKFCAPRFSAVVRLTPVLEYEGSSAGLVVMGTQYAALALKAVGRRLTLAQTACEDAPGGGQELQIGGVDVPPGDVFLRVDVAEGALCSFSYSFDGKVFTKIGKLFTAQPESWTGAKMGLFCTLPGGAPGGENTHVDVDWFHIEPLK